MPGLVTPVWAPEPQHHSCFTWASHKADDFPGLTQVCARMRDASISPSGTAEASTQLFVCLSVSPHSALSHFHIPIVSPHP
uniref:Uncharacterized protein n=1 Tax=Malurus cyaneus samueli TaxID=2593467 RepID=A0A8C5X729_9PASS